MKKMKRLITIALSLVLSLSMSVTAFCEDKTKYARQIVALVAESGDLEGSNPDIFNGISREMAAFFSSVSQDDTVNYAELEDVMNEYGISQKVKDRFKYIYDCWAKGDYAALERGMNYGEFEISSPAKPASDSEDRDREMAAREAEEAPAKSDSSSVNPPTPKNAWDGVWEMTSDTAAQILVIKNGGQSMYHVDEMGNGFTISASSDEITATEIHTEMNDTMIDYYAAYDFVLSADGQSLTFVCNYDYNNNSMVTPDSGTYVKTNREPYSTYDLLRNDKSGINMEPPKEVQAISAPVTEVKTADNEQNIQAISTASTVIVNTEEVAFGAYNINGSNYFMLRDLALALQGTNKQFDVSWDGENNAISLTSGNPYKPVGNELQENDGANKEAVVTNSTVIIDGEAVSFTAYNIDGNNYFMLRDIGKAFDFYIGWDGDSNTITIETANSYE